MRNFQLLIRLYGCENYSDKTDDWDAGKDDPDLNFDDKDFLINSDLDISFREHKDVRIC